MGSIGANYRQNKHEGGAKKNSGETHSAKGLNLKRLGAPGSLVSSLVFKSAFYLGQVKPARRLVNWQRVLICGELLLLFGLHRIARHVFTLRGEGNTGKG